MANTPAYDPTDSRYYDAKDLRSEVERVFSLCADCRMCVKFCGSFPKMFDAIDDYCTEGKYAEVDTKKLKTEDVNKVVDLCFQCKLCYIKCPYTPGDHEWAIDFPRLMTRAKAQEVKKNGVPLVDKLLGNPDLVGKIGSAGAPLANWANNNTLNRRLLHSMVGIHKDKKLPPFASQTFAKRFRTARSNAAGEPAAKVAFFSTCYVNYNQPEIGIDTLEVMDRNNVDVAPAYEQCCGMPLWHNGDVAGSIEAARQNVTSLIRHVDAGRTVIATNPTCSQMIRVEYPRLLGTEEAKRVSAKTMDPMEFLAGLASSGKLNRDFKTGAGALSYHMPCHLRAQNVGYKTRDVLALLPDTTIKVVEECSGHDGTWAMKKENFEQSMKYGSRAFKEMAEGNPKSTCSDCPLAAIQIEQGNGRRPLNPMQILAKSYRGEPIE
ncbi:MAG TPA: heterodisulfide reductase-related iron-sulfur binding cluster [Candidatus Binatia bacterium]|nr:heterodisulfide reductase-related iron-sulfur binding cluster [Candidatus Binatia bacterium]